MTLFKRRPMIFWRPKRDEQIVRPAVQASAPEFAGDFALLEEVLLPQFRAMDNEALLMQNQFRLDQVILIAGGMLATILGSIQAALAESAWPGIVEAVLAIILAAIAQRSRALRAQERYLTNRLKAETLRSEYFLFLGRVGSYADEALRAQHLRRRVAEIRAGKERA